MFNLAQNLVDKLSDMQAEVFLYSFPTIEVFFSVVGMLFSENINENAEHLAYKEYQIGWFLDSLEINEVAYCEGSEGAHHLLLFLVTGLSTLEHIGYVVSFLLNLFSLGDLNERLLPFTL